MQGLTGKLSGKMGSAVFRVREGQQIVTQYNPLVKNPNSDGQQAQRAKFKLMSQLAAVMAPGFGTMGTINRPARGKSTQRNAFTQINMKLVKVVRDGQNVTAKIPMEKVKLTSSFRYFPTIGLTDGHQDGIKLNTNGQIPSEVTTVRLITVGYVGNVATIADIRDIPSAQVTGSSIPVGSGQYTVLAFGLIPSESAKTSIDLDNIHTPTDEKFVSAVKLDSMVAEGSMVETMTVGENITITDQ